MYSQRFRTNLLSQLEAVTFVPTTSLHVCGRIGCCSWSQTIFPRLSRHSCSISRSTVHSYLQKTWSWDRSNSTVRQSWPRGIENIAWGSPKIIRTGRDWRRVLWSKESSFEFHNPPNHHNCRGWPVSSSRSASRLHSEASYQKARPGILSLRAMSQLQVVPQLTVINGEYYRANEHLRQGMFIRDQPEGSKRRGFQRSLIADTSQVVFVQDRDSRHTAQKSQHWCRENLPGFWERAVWPENSPNLSPTENLCVILQDKVNKIAPATTADELMKQLKRVWRNIQPCAEEPGGENAVSDAWLHHQHGRPYRGIKGKTKYRFFFTYGVQM